MTQRKAEIEENEEDLNSSQAKINKNAVRIKDEKVDTQPSITAKIGKGDDAKNSIVWTITRWTFIVPTMITILYIITIWMLGSSTPHAAHLQEIKEIRADIIKIWGIFIPVLTLILGYLYGKNESIKSKPDTEKS